MDRVFVSYSHRDQAWVDELTDLLVDAGVDVWIDRRDIPVSVDWLEELEKAIVDSTLFLECRSEHWERSRHCTAEAAMADELHKERVEVPVGGDVMGAAVAVTSALTELDDPARARTLLVSKAFQWDLEGWPRSLLPNLRERRRLERGVRGGPSLHVLERAYLDASRARSRRWRRIASVIAALPLVPVVLNGALELTQQRASQQAFNITTIDTVLERNERSAYLGLQLTSGLGFAENWLNAEALHQSLNRPVPDDRIRIDADVTGFAMPVIDDVVAVTSADGPTWVRAVDEDSLRAVPAEQADFVLPGPADVTSSSRTAGLDIDVAAGTATVMISRDGVRYRTLIAERPVTAAALAPDGRTVAVAAGQVVHLFDLELGQRRTDLRGAPGSIIDLAFTADGGRVFAAVADGAVAWSIRVGTRLVDEPDRRFEAVLPSDDDAEVWLVDRYQGLRRIDVTTGAELGRIELDDPVYGATADPEGRVAVVHHLDAIGIVDLVTGTVQRTSPDDCSSFTPVVAPDASRVLVPCSRGPLVVVDVATGQEVGREELPLSGTSAVGFAAGTGETYVGSEDGAILFMTEDGTIPDGQLRCRSELRAIAVSDDGRFVVPVGIGTGAGGCSSRLRVDAEGERHWDSYADYDRQATMARAATHVPDRDAFAVGYDDGTVRLRPSVNIEPHHRFDEVHGTVTGLLARPSVQQLLVATRSGVLHILPTGGVPLTNADAAVEAEARLARARELGLTDRIPIQDVEVDDGDGAADVARNGARVGS